MATAPNLAAILPSPQAKLQVRELPIPTPGPGELLVRNHAVAINPIDWKRQAFDILIPSYPALLGADVAVDYRSPSAADELVAAAAAIDKEIVYAVDAISLPHTLGPVAQVLGRFSGTKKIAHTLPWPADLAVPVGVGKETVLMHVLPAWLAEGRIPPIEHRVVPGGLEGIQDGLDELKAGRVSGEKLVVEVWRQRFEAKG